MKKINRILILFITTIISQLSFAESIPSTLTVSSNLESSCNLKINDVFFNDLKLKNDTVQLGMLNILCTLNTTYSLNIISDTPTSDSKRYLTDGTPNSDIIVYRVSIPGDGLITDEIFFNSTGTGLIQPQFLAFTILRGQYVKPGTYSETLTINANF